MKRLKYLLGATMAMTVLLLASGAPLATADSCPNAVFRTGPSASLPDCRAFELVSPADAAGEVYVRPGDVSARDSSTERLVRAAADGSGVTYLADPSAIGGNGAIGDGLGNQYLATRGAAGWAASDITPSGAFSGDSYVAFTDDLSQGILFSEEKPLTGDIPSGCDGLYARASADGVLHALFSETKTPGYCGVTYTGFDNFLFAGASGDDSQLLFQAQAALIPQAIEATGEGNDLYDSAGGRLSLVNVLPGGGIATDATFGAFSNNAEPPDFSGVISVDGSRAYWTDLATGTVYLRENPSQPQSALDGGGACVEPAKACTVQVSEGGSAQYWTATPDGRYAYYTEGGGLWRFDAQTQSRQTLTGPGAGVQGVIGVNETGEDGSYLYFVAKGALAPGAVARTCVSAAAIEEPGTVTSEERQEEAEGYLPVGTGCNLYLLRAGAPVKLVAALSARDDRFYASERQVGDWRPDLGSRIARLTPDGHSLVFESILALVEAQGSRSGGVFVYDSEDERVSCASCNPSGVREFGTAQRADTLLPVSFAGTYAPRWVSPDGSRVFFDSTGRPVALGADAQAATGYEYENVYEWQREGVAGCPPSAATGVNGGCIRLLSDGAGSGDSAFVEASVSGDDVFLASREQLDPQALDDHMKLYDARVDGGFPAPGERVSCVGDACRGALPSSVSVGLVGSAAFSGAGNLAQPVVTAPPRRAAKRKPPKCSKGRQLRHGKCVKKHAKRAGAKRSSERGRGK